jgi:hypothetical protein
MSRQFRLILVLGGVVALSGCDPLHRQAVRDAEIPSLAGADDPSFRKPDELHGFFKPRGSGAWSSEAREIERNLGAY